MRPGQEPSQTNPLGNHVLNLFLLAGVSNLGLLFVISFVLEPRSRTPDRRLELRSWGPGLEPGTMVYDINSPIYFSLSSSLQSTVNSIYDHLHNRLEGVEAGAGGSVSVYFFINLILRPFTQPGWRGAGGHLGPKRHHITPIWASRMMRKFSSFILY